MTRPLEGIRVLDMSRAQMGPYAGAILADMGAAVVKVEQKTGDFSRGAFLSSWYPPGTIDCYCLAHNRGKRSLALDYHSVKGREVVLRLAENSDVFPAASVAVAVRLGPANGVLETSIHRPLPAIEYPS